MARARSSASRASKRGSRSVTSGRVGRPRGRGQKQICELFFSVSSVIGTVMPYDPALLRCVSSTDR